MKSKKVKLKKTSFILKFIFTINIAFLISILLSITAPYISPDKFWPIAFFGLSYPVFFLINLFFLVFWIIFKRKYAIWVLLVLVLGTNHFFKIVQSNKKVSENELQEAFKVISFNVKNFDIYNYKKHWQHNFTNRNKVLRLLEEEQPDLLCFQEYVHDKSGAFKTTDTLKKFLKAKYKHIVYTTNSRNINYFGIATYSSYPIIDTGRIEFKTISGNICIYSDIKINEDTVRVYNVHFESIRLKSEDYIFAEKVKKDLNNDSLELRKNSERILARLKRAFVIRAPQARMVAEHIKKCPYPIIVCSDFNDPPVSYSYNVIASLLKDAFVERGNRIGQTYAGIFPSFRIDYIMYSKSFSSSNFETITEAMSDHYPVKCYIKLNK